MDRESGGRRGENKQLSTGSPVLVVAPLFPFLFSFSPSPSFSLFLLSRKRHPFSQEAARCGRWTAAQCVVQCELVRMNINSK